MWTRFRDMLSGGMLKLGSGTIWIEAENEKAINLFESIFGINPENVTCDCCGEDYSISECDFEPNCGDCIVTQTDIINFESKDMLELNSSL